MKTPRPKTPKTAPPQFDKGGKKTPPSTIPSATGPLHPGSVAPKVPTFDRPK